MTELSTLPSRRASIHVENFKNQIGKFVVRRRRSNSFFGRVNGRLTTSTSSLVSQISLSLTGEPAEVSTVTNLDTVLRYFINYKLLILYQQYIIFKISVFNPG